MPRGGYRPGAGRKKGTPNVKTTEVAAGALATGVSPLEFLLTTMRDETADLKERQWAAEKAAPYCHARPAPSQRTVEVPLPDVTTAEGVAKALAVIAGEVSAGNIAPSEAQSLASIVEAQRKSIETVDIASRIEKLEAAMNVKAGRGR